MSTPIATEFLVFLGVIIAVSSLVGFLCWKLGVVHGETKALKDQTEKLKTLRRFL